MSYKKLTQVGFTPGSYQGDQIALQQGIVRSQYHYGGRSSNATFYKSSRINAHVSKYKYGSINKASYIQTQRHRNASLPYLGEGAVHARESQEKQRVNAVNLRASQERIVIRKKGRRKKKRKGISIGLG